MQFETIAGGLKPTEVLNVRRLPAKLTVDQAAVLLGFASHDIPILVAAKLLKPLGKPRPNSIKWFPSCVIDGLRADVKWLNAATAAIGDHWMIANAKKREASNPPAQHPVA